jgi:hypothetical protein
MEGSMPEDLVAGRGCPPLDARAKSLILGGNLLRLHGWPQSREADLDDAFVAMRKQHPEPWSRVRQREALS